MKKQIHKIPPYLCVCVCYCVCYCVCVCAHIHTHTHIYLCVFDKYKNISIIFSKFHIMQNQLNILKYMTLTFSLILNGLLPTLIPTQAPCSTLSLTYFPAWKIKSKTYPSQVAAICINTKCLLDECMYFFKN